MADIHIRRCTGNRDAWVAELDPSGYMIGTALSLDDLVTRVASCGSQAITLHVAKDEATRLIDRYIVSAETELRDSRRAARGASQRLASYRAERDKIAERVGDPS